MFNHILKRKSRKILIRYYIRKQYTNNKFDIDVTNVKNNKYNQYQMTLVILKWMIMEKKGHGRGQTSSINFQIFKERQGLQVHKKLWIQNSYSRNLIFLYCLIYFCNCFWKEISYQHLNNQILKSFWGLESSENLRTVFWKIPFLPFTLHWRKKYLSNLLYEEYENSVSIKRFSDF